MAIQDHIPNELFTLERETERTERWKPAIRDAKKLTQRVLFSGLDCEPGQLDLFPTDGVEDNESL